MEIISNSDYLNQLMAWAVQKTADFVVTGTKAGPVNLGDGGKWYGPSGRIFKRSRLSKSHPGHGQPRKIIFPAIGLGIMTVRPFISGILCIRLWAPSC